MTKRRPIATVLSLAIALGLVTHARAAEKPKADLVSQLLVCLTKDPSSITMGREPLVDTSKTTDPVRIERIEMVRQLAPIAERGAASVAGDYVKAWDEATTAQRRLLTHCLPRLVRTHCRNQNGVAALNAIQSKIDSSGVDPHPLWEQMSILARMGCHRDKSESGKILAELRSLAGLEKIRVSSPSYGPSLVFDKPLMLLMRQASSEQLIETSSLLLALADKVEDQCGQKPQAWVIGAKLRSKARRADRLVLVKQAFVEAP